MKCGEIPPISTKMGKYGRIPPQGGDTLPNPVLNVILLQPSEKPTRACDSTAFMNSHAGKWNSRENREFYNFHGEFTKFHHFGIKRTSKASIWTRYSLLKSMPRARGGRKVPKSPKSTNFNENGTILVKYH